MFIVFSYLPLAANRQLLSILGGAIGKESNNVLILTAASNGVDGQTFKCGSSPLPTYPDKENFRKENHCWMQHPVLSSCPGLRYCRISWHVLANSFMHVLWKFGFLYMNLPLDPSTAAVASSSRDSYNVTILLSWYTYLIVSAPPISRTCQCWIAAEKYSNLLAA